MNESCFWCRRNNTPKINWNEHVSEQYAKNGLYNGMETLFTYYDK